MSKIKILIADDHEMFIDSLKLSLQTNEDFIVLDSCSNGDEVIQKAATQLPDIILMDISMPKIDGLKASYEIKRSNPLIKIIILTMHADKDEYIKYCREISLDGYMLKTSSLSSLEEAIYIVYGGGTYFDKSIVNYNDDLEFKSRDTSSVISLTKREREIISLIVEGYSSKEIGSILNISFNTVNNHRTNIFKKLDITSTTELIKYVNQSKLFN
jgi:DNA-binding NarL/FixJ family response regulator